MNVLDQSVVRALGHSIQVNQECRRVSILIAGAVVVMFLVTIGIGMERLEKD